MKHAGKRAIGSWWPCPACKDRFVGEQRLLMHLKECAAHQERQRLDWLESHEYQLRSHREKGIGEWLIWWTVTTRYGKALSHPMGGPRAAIDEAKKAAKARWAAKEGK